MVYIQQVSDAQLDTASSDDKSSEEVEDVSENLNFCFLFYGFSTSIGCFLIGLLFSSLIGYNPVSLELLGLCNLFQNIGEGL